MALPADSLRADPLTRVTAPLLEVLQQRGDFGRGLYKSARTSASG